ncbi:MAG: hypothetical protein IKQ73_02505 [Oscillospiraceae bacterium]|nr:hypothetical protein [Oscillospiraceae bacterium]MBR7057604.1 hypothetical protein [Stomatobaculum sp.]
MEYIEDSDRCPELEQVLQEIMELLASMTKENRLAWFRQTMYGTPVTFMREIDGTVYLVRSLFEADAGENIREKVGRIVTDPSFYSMEEQDRI